MIAMDWVRGQESAPAFSLMMEGKDITANIEKRLMSLTLTDNRGFEADQLDIELDDADGALALPRRGVVLVLSLGWKGQALTPKGRFVVDEIEHFGAPDKLTLRARSADFRDTLNIQREASYHDKTLGDIVKTIAKRNKLNVAMDSALEKVKIPHVDQTNESDGSFLTRLAKQEGAMASVKGGKLLFIRQGQSRTASGKPIPAVTIMRGDGDQHRFGLADRGAYTGVTASWLNTREPKKKEQVAVKRKRKPKSKAKPKEPEAKQGDYLMGTEGNVLVLGHTYANKGNAERAAKAAWQKLQRGVATFSIQLARGRAELYPEMPVKVQGFKAEIDAADWLLTTVTHSLSGGGYTTALELEVKIDDLDME
ncbi:phage late control D family protein [Hafnia paralvei]|uniref:phage late control D family protein n=1 Tax=Hafnia paralvei TaxID=546367 RepID=UPI001034608A|nr:phage late control D family protein [Hafnia paralvei]TBM25678.1 phage late control D family protein [Hafnia paralvei]